MLLPQPLIPGDTIAIITPATVIKKEYYDNALKFLSEAGFNVKQGKHIRCGYDGSIAGNARQRASDLMDALADTEVKAIWCARGGYGSVELLPLIDKELISKNPKWLIGFSDICALHALWLRCGVATLHAPMLRSFSNGNEPWLTIRATTGSVEIQSSGSGDEKPGIAEGVLIGGNLSVWGDLQGSGYGFKNLSGKKILFLEDVGESINRIKRRLWGMYLAGVFDDLEALAFGRFSAYEPNCEYASMEAMLRECMDVWGINVPVAYNLPIGHGGTNLPLIMGVRARLEITKELISLRTLKN